MSDVLTIVPANEASWEDLQAVFGTRGDPSRCCCQRYKMQPRESWASVGAEEITWGELHVGSGSIFADAGFTEVSHPTLRRVVMRINF